MSSLANPSTPTPHWNPDAHADGNLREAIVQHIRIGIVSGQIAPDELLTVPSLSKSLGVSTTPIREALLELSNAGLIEPRRNRGFRVCSTSPKELEDLFSIRAQLESFALSLIEGCSEQEEAELHRLAKDVQASVEQGDTVGYVMTDRAFHQRLVSLAGNPKLTQLIMDLRNNMRLYGIETQAGRERQSKSVQEHFEMIRLICDGKSAVAAELVKPHILDWQPIFLEALKDAGGAA
ncbi:MULTISPECIES: GntR family transcriptional regulator [unclassified Pseudomonas]|uniref:GntR family transcriptional regulator n=1 Tax=unclassified Pseudomonas TaxID=196821 RepID=UPI0035C155F8